MGFSGLQDAALHFFPGNRLEASLVEDEVQFFAFIPASCSSNYLDYFVLFHVNGFYHLSHKCSLIVFPSQLFYFQILILSIFAGVVMQFLLQACCCN